MKAPGGRRARGPREIRRLAQRLAGARVAYGTPIRVGERTVIPVAGVWALGGFGFGGGALDAAAEQGGGGGVLRSRPLGFIDAGPEGARFERIGGRTSRVATVAAAVAAGAVAGGAVAGTAVGAGMLRRLARAKLPASRPRRRRRRRRGLRAVP